MTVYVDDMRANFGRMIMCHMIADTDQELRAMADKIGVAQRWHQGDHFDISISRRILALQSGAVEITWRQCSMMCLVRRYTGTLPLPSNVLAEFRTMMAERRERRAG